MELRVLPFNRREWQSNPDRDPDAGTVRMPAKDGERHEQRRDGLVIANN
jgi:hypothetical protein